jgi:hypothetical protein
LAAAEKSKGSGKLLTVRSLDVTPLTDEELAQVVGVGSIDVTVKFGPIAVGLVTPQQRRQ